MNRELLVWHPFRSFRDFDRTIDRFFGNTEAGSTYGASSAFNRWTPAVDIEETDDALLLRADIPGVDPKDVHIEVKDSVLTLRGERASETENAENDKSASSTTSTYRLERSFGSFTRSFVLPRTVDAEKVDASYRNGVLQISLPKKAEAKPRQIEVKLN